MSIEFKDMTGLDSAKSVAAIAFLPKLSANCQKADPGLPQN
jgi:hypothetical protein